MALAASGTISFSDLRDEFSPGSNTSISFSDYYLNGSKVKPKAGDNNATHLGAGIPTSGALDLSDFYSKAIGYKFTISSNATDQNASTIFGDDYDVDYPKIITVNSGVTVGATSTSAYAINVPSGASGSVTIENAGNILGYGGSANGGAGGDAIFAGSACTVTNTGTLASGGGGGGKGGDGGKGVVALNSVLGSFVDEGGVPYGGGNAPANDAPSWFNAGTTPGYGGSNNLNGSGVVADRKWGGVNQNAQQSGSVNTSWGFYTSSTSFSGSLSNRGPFYCSFQLGTAATYTMSLSLSSTYGSGYGTPTINISTSNSSASQGQGGGTYTNGAPVDLAADTTYYLVGYLSGIGGGTNLYYNNFNFSISLTVNSVTAAGAGGNGGVGAGYGVGAGSGASGSSGGTNAGNGGNGGSGGAYGTSGSSGSNGTDGGGSGITFPAEAPTLKLIGGSGGAAGNYINGISNVTLSNSGTVAGSTA